MPSSPWHDRCVLVTGGAGFLGVHLVDRLLDAGARVHVIDLAPPNRNDVTWTQGDLTDLATIAGAVDGVDTVFHCAARVALNVRMPATERARVWDANVTATRLLLKAATAAGVPRVVFTSSNHVVFSGRAIHGGDESLPYVDHRADHYCQSKAAAERLVLASGRATTGPATCALRPGALFGEGDPHFLPVLLSSTRRLGRIVTWEAAFTHIDFSYIGNVVDAHLAAALALSKDSSVNGQAYFISDEAPMSSADFQRLLFAALGESYPVLALPPRAVRRAARWLELGYQAGLWPRPRLGRGDVRTVAASNSFSTAKARRDFGYRPTVSAEAAIRRSALSFRHERSRM